MYIYVTLIYCGGIMVAQFERMCHSDFYQILMLCFCSGTRFSIRVEVTLNHRDFILHYELLYVFEWI